MPQLIIQFAPDAPSRQLLFRVSLHSDEDTTPGEHEQDHRRLVRSLFPGIDLDNRPGSRVEVERERPEAEPVLGCSCGGDDYEVIDLG